VSTETEASLEEREKQIIWMSGYYMRAEYGHEPGGFYKCLIEAFFKADSDNRRRLKSAFPITAQAFESYMKGELKEKYNLPED